MKHVFFTALFALSTIMLSAQVKEIIQHDDVAQLKSHLETNKLDECLMISGDNYNLLILAIKYEAMQVFHHVLDNKADLDHICADKSPLMYAVKYNRVEMFKTLVESGADLEVKSKIKKRSVLDYIKKYERQDIASYLDEMK